MECGEIFLVMNMEIISSAMMCMAKHNITREKFPVRWTEDRHKLWLNRNKRMVIDVEEDEGEVLEGKKRGRGVEGGVKSGEPPQKIKKGMSSSSSSSSLSSSSSSSSSTSSSSSSTSSSPPYIHLNGKIPPLELEEMKGTLRKMFHKSNMRQSDGGFYVSIVCAFCFRLL